MAQSYYNIDEVSIVAKNWVRAKKQAYELQEGRCSICGEPLDRIYIGHHRDNRSQGGKDTPENCEVRHPQPCESWAHQVDRFGNPTPQQIARFLQVGE